MNAARAWRRKSEQSITAICGDNRLAHFNFVVLKVASGKKTAVLLHPFCDCLCEWPAIKPVNSMFCYPAVSKRQIRLLENVSFHERMAAFEEHLAGRIETRQLMLD